MSLRLKNEIHFFSYDWCALKGHSSIYELVHMSFKFPETFFLFEKMNSFRIFNKHCLYYSFILIF